MYGPEHQRIRQNVTLTSNGTSSYFAGNTWYLNGEDSLGLTYEKEVRANGTIEHKHYLTAPGLTFAVFTSRTGTLNGLPAATTSYFSHDQLGSISAITNEAGVVTERLAYDPWGKRRFINSTPGLADKLDAIVGIRTDRGYTEHEHLDEMGVIHMNGRIFDPLMGRFMSADPIVQAPYNLKSFNRYSYVWNNPLVMFDPTGYSAYIDSYSNAGYTGTTEDSGGIGGVSFGAGGGQSRQVGGNSGNVAPEAPPQYFNSNNDCRCTWVSVNKQTLLPSTGNSTVAVAITNPLPPMTLEEKMKVRNEAGNLAEDWEKVLTYAAIACAGSPCAPAAPGIFVAALGATSVKTAARMEVGTLIVDKSIGALVEGAGGRFRVGPLGRELVSDSLENTDWAKKAKEYADAKFKQFMDAIK